MKWNITVLFFKSLTEWTGTSYTPVRLIYAFILKNCHFEGGATYTPENTYCTLCYSGSYVERHCFRKSVHLSLQSGRLYRYFCLHSAFLDRTEICQNFERASPHPTYLGFKKGLHSSLHKNASKCKHLILLTVMPARKSGAGFVARVFSVPLVILNQITLWRITLFCSAANKWICLEAWCHVVSLLPALHDDFYCYTVWNSKFYSCRFEFAKSENSPSACSRVQVVSLKQPVELGITQRLTWHTASNKPTEQQIPNRTAIMLLGTSLSSSSMEYISTKI